MTPVPPTPVTRAARAIAGDSPPTWIEPAIQTFVTDILSGAINKENGRPGREKFRKRLRETIDAATFIKVQLDGYYPHIPRISDQRQYPLYDMLLIDDDKGALDFAQDLHHSLNALVKRCEMKLQVMPDTKGGNKPDIDITCAPLKGKVLCALMVRLLWYEIHNSWPGVKCHKAQEACAALWEAAGGDITRHWGATNAGWRQPLEKARGLKDGRPVDTLRTIMGGCK